MVSMKPTSSPTRLPTSSNLGCPSGWEKIISKPTRVSGLCYTANGKILFKLNHWRSVRRCIKKRGIPCTESDQKNNDGGDDDDLDEQICASIKNKKFCKRRKKCRWSRPDRSCTLRKNK